MSQPILLPVVALVGWSLVILVRLLVVRFAAMRVAGISLKGRVGGRGQDLERVLPPEAQWPAHNYAHLVEQPTLFYALALALAVADAGNGLNLLLAWAYVALRVAHSLVQITRNVINLRFLLFFASSLVLIALTISAAISLI